MTPGSGPNYTTWKSALDHIKAHRAKNQMPKEINDLFMLLLKMGNLDFELKSMRVTAEYVGCNDNRLIARPGDTLLTCTRDAKNAYAFNLTKQTDGITPTDQLVLNEQNVSVGSDLCIASGKGSGQMAMKAGDHIQVFEYDNVTKASGIGVNLETGWFGRFAAVPALAAFDRVGGGAKVRPVA